MYGKMNDRVVHNGSKIVDILMDNPQGLCAADICYFLKFNRLSFYKAVYYLDKYGAIKKNTSNRPVLYRYNPEGREAK